MGPTDGELAAAWAQITGPIVAPAGALAALWPTWRRAHLQGDPRAELAAIGRNFAGKSWRWPWFDEWHARFRQTGLWPDKACWYEISSTLQTPKDLRAAAELFAVPDLRAWAAANAVTLGPARKREDVLAAFCAEVRWPAFSGAALQRFSEMEARQEEKRRDAKFQLLALSIGFRAANLHRLAQLAEMTGTRYAYVQADPDGLSYSEEAAARFNAGDHARVPPFFPGDASIVRGRRR